MTTPVAQALESHRRLIEQGQRTLVRAAQYLGYARAACQHPRPVSCRGIILCGICGASWGQEDVTAPRATPVSAEEFRRVEEEAP